MIHVVFDARSVTDHYPGIGRYGSGLTQALAELHEVRLTLLVDPRAVSTFHSLPDIERVPIACGPTSLSQQWVIPGVLRSLRADVYHSPYYLMPYRTPCPTVVTFYDLIPLIVPEAFSALFKLLYRVAHHLAAAAADRIIAISRSTAADLARIGLPERKISAIALGVGREFHLRSEQEIEAVRQRYGLPERFALYVGTNKPHKNLPRLIEAWASVSRKMSESDVLPWTLVVAGREDPRFPRAANLASACGLTVTGSEEASLRVRPYRDACGGENFPPRRGDRGRRPLSAIGAVPEADLPVLYSAASLFIFPSLYEGFGLPVLEAMACGTPVICSNTSSLPEIAGDAALMVDPINTEALAKTINLALSEDSLREELKAKGLAQAAAFSWEQTARKTLEVYRLEVNS